MLPKEIRERLGVTPGTEVKIREVDGKAIVEPEEDPEEIIERMERLIEETSPGEHETTPLDDGVDPIARKHSDAVRRGAGKIGTLDGRIRSSSAPRTPTSGTRTSIGGESIPYRRTGVVEDGEATVRVANPGEYAVGEEIVTVSEEVVYAGGRVSIHLDNA